ncbi:unnamed protein product [Prorocentrum cordatum]|uniref:Uncharacterized protein n=1 Tax=Prorocentrum cordatum TaxID=2364126 RepID=A0ABN9XX29_9DINO|nr:unnamed protein product [Polarella glacialis]
MARHEAARPGEDGELGGAAADGALAVSPEELQLLAEIRAMEIDMSLMDLRGQLEAQEAFLEQWQKDLEKEKGAPREARASLESAQRQVADLRRHIGQLEDSRPPRPNPAPPTEEDTQAPAPRACDGATERAEMTAPLARPWRVPPRPEPRPLRPAAAQWGDAALLGTALALPRRGLVPISPPRFRSRRRFRCDVGFRR